MRMADIFGRTLRQAPSGYDPSTAYALRAALIRMVQDQIVYLPLGMRVLEKLEGRLRKSLGEENLLGASQPVTINCWMAMIDDEIQSYRQLPLFLFRRQPEYLTDQARGLGRPTWVNALQWQYGTASTHSQTEQQESWMERCEKELLSLGLHPQRTEWDSHDVGWANLCQTGPEQFLVCPSCQYMASQQIARFQRMDLEIEQSAGLEMVSTPDADTIECLAEFLDIPVERTLKAVFLTTDAGDLIFSVLRGDLEISLPKLVRILGCQSLRPASAAEIEQAGAEAGYASPIGLQVREGEASEGVYVIGDLSIELGGNFAAGANKHGFHFTGVNYPRDFQVTQTADIAMAMPKTACPECSEALESRSGFYLGGWHNRSAAFHFSDESGEVREGYAGIGILYLELILAALIDVHHDNGVMQWPQAISPYDVYLVDLRSPQEASMVQATLEQAGLSVLLDDRDVSPGVKFKDADLIGCFIRLTVSKRSLEQGGVEFCCRSGGREEILAIESLRSEVPKIINTLM